MATEQSKPTRSDPDPSATTPPADAAETLGGPVAAAVDPSLPPELADHPRYRVLGLLGRGGMGAVYKAEHRVMERLVALKVMRPDLIDNPAAVERFRREVKAAAQLVHLHIVTAFDAEQVGHLHFLVMEYVAGRDLATVVAEQGRLPLPRAASYIRQAARGLQHAADKGMIHRDIKPHNLMLLDHPDALDAELRAHGQVKILDFGLARFASEEAGGPKTESGVIMGTVDFMAPEQADSARKADIRSDIYSLGCTLYYLLAGRAVFPEGTLIQRVMSHVEKPPPSLSAVRPELPAGLERVLTKMLAKDPDRRYQTPNDVADALYPFLDTSIANVVPVVEAVDEVLPADETEVLSPAPIVAKPRSHPPAPAPRRGSRVWLGCFLLALVTIVGTITAGYFLVRDVVDRVGSFISGSIANASVDDQRWKELEQKFVAPKESGLPAAYFPSRVGAFDLAFANLQAGYAPLDISMPGHHGEYISPDRERRLHICMYKATELEKEAVYGRVLAKMSPPASPPGKPTITAANDARSVSGTAKGAYLVYRRGLGKDAENGTFWWHDGWLFYVRCAPGDDSTGTLQQFVREMSARKWEP